MFPSPEQQRWMYQTMVTSRIFEEMTEQAYMEGKQPVFNMAEGPIPGEMHLSNGQEPCAVGVCAHLGEQDVVTATHRPHHIAIAKNIDLPAMAAEIFGKNDGLSGGRGGHMHLFDTRVNFVCSGIIAQGMGPAVGAALTFKMRKQPLVAVAFIGEGAANQGAFHEAMNLAAVWQLPFVCVIEDNNWGISVAKQASTAVPRNDVRAQSYGIPGHHVADNDTYHIYEVAGEAIARARAGEGPSLIEIETTRLAGHFMGDAEAYRPAGEKTSLFARDPIVRMREHLLQEQVLDETEANAIEQVSRNRVEEAFAFARASDYPRPEQALDCVFV